MSLKDIYLDIFQKKDWNYIDRIEEAARKNNYRPLTLQSLNYFKDRMSVFKDRDNKKLIDDYQKFRSKAFPVLPGCMYTFQYDAKHKATLPYFDRMPLIILVDFTKTGFYRIKCSLSESIHSSVIF